MNTNAKASSSKVTAKVTRNQGRKVGGPKTKNPKHDVGLSTPERVLVHALRAIFLPKGGNSEKLSSEVHQPFVSRKQAGKSVKGKGLTPGSRKMKKGSKAHTPKKASDSKNSGKVPTAKAADVSGKKHKSPSKLLRAAKRKAALDQSAVPGMNLRRYGPEGEVKSILNSQEGRREGWFGPKISSITPKKGVSEITVIQAFGGAQALDMLKDMSNGPQLSFRSYVPLMQNNEVHPTKVSHKHRIGCLPFVWKTVVRDYTKASVAIKAQTAKMGLFLRPAPVVGGKKKEAKKAKQGEGQTAKPKPSGEKKARPSQVRRLATRAERRKVDVTYEEKSVEASVVEPVRNLAEMSEDEPESSHKVLLKARDQLKKLVESYEDVELSESQEKGYLALKNRLSQLSKFASSAKRVDELLVG
jgi:hypothetical protein